MQSICLESTVLFVINTMKHADIIFGQDSDKEFMNMQIQARNALML